MSNLPIFGPSSRCIEYGAVPEGGMAQRQVIATAETVSGHIATFAYWTKGYRCAGSMARLDDANWSVTVEIGGATHGQSFRDTDEGEAKARAFFAKWTDQVAVASARIERAEAAAKCAEIDAERAIERKAWFLEMCRTYNLKPNTKRARDRFRYYGAI